MTDELVGQVKAQLRGVPVSWRTVLALKLAAALDAEPNASMARELRAVMNEILEKHAPQVKGKGDELRARRAARIANTKA